MDGLAMSRRVGGESGLRHGRARLGFGLFVGLLLLVAAGKAVLFDSFDPDFFWHLRVADVLAQQKFPHEIVDQLSFASIKTPWTPYSWLAELAMKAVWDFWQVRGAVAAQAILAMAIVLFTALAALEGTVAATGSPRYLASGIVAAAAEFLALPFISLRPVTIGMAMLAVIAWLIQRDRRMGEKSRCVWIIVPLTVLLANVHLFVVFVPMVVGAFFAGACSEKNRSSIRRYGILLACVSVASACTPLLPGMIRTAFGYATTDVMVASPIIAELQPFYKGSTGPVAVIFLLAAVICGWWQRRVLRPADWILLGFSVLVMARLGRFTPLFGMFCAPMLAIALPRLSDRSLGNNAIAAALVALLALGAVRIAGAFPTAGESVSAWLERLGPDSPGYPTESCDYVANNVSPRSHHLISEFTWGGYMEWRLGNNYQVLVDGRTQLFPAALWKALYLGTPTERKAYLARLDADAAVLPLKGSAFAADLIALNWKVVHQDARAQVLTPP